MSLIDILTNSPHYFYGKSIGTVNENFNFDIRDYRVKRELRIFKNTLTKSVDNKGKTQSRLKQRMIKKYFASKSPKLDKRKPLMRVERYKVGFFSGYEYV